MSCWCYLRGFSSQRRISKPHPMVTITLDIVSRANMFGSSLWMSLFNRCNNDVNRDVFRDAATINHGKSMVLSTRNDCAGRRGCVSKCVGERTAITARIFVARRAITAATCVSIDFMRAMITAATCVSINFMRAKWIARPKFIIEK